MKKTRLVPGIKFPQNPFIPGQGIHPKKRENPFQEPVAKPLGELSALENIVYHHGIDLFNFGYFWEAHVYFEALWIAEGKIGAKADFFKGLIKLCAAGVKGLMKDPELAIAHIDRAKELFTLSLEEFSNISYLELLEFVDVFQIEVEKNKISGGCSRLLPWPGVS